MTRIALDFSGSTDGATATTGNTGADIVNIGAGNVLEHDHSVTYQGLTALRQNAAGGEECNYGILLESGWLNFGAFFYQTADSTGTVEQITIEDENNSTVGVIRWRPGRNIRIANDVNVTSANDVIPLGSVYRVEVDTNKSGQAQAGVADGDMRVRLFADPASTTPDVELTAGCVTGSGTPAKVLVGNENGAGNANDIWTLYPVLQDEGPVGPYTGGGTAEPPTVAPVLVTATPIVENDTVTLDGQATPPDGETITAHEWEQTGGTTTALSSTTVEGPTFTAPAGPLTLTYRYRATASNGLTSAWASVSIPISETPSAVGPSNTTASADPSNVPVGDTVTFSYVTTVGDAAIVSQTWTEPAGVTLSSTTTASPTWDTTGATEGDYTLTLTVEDANGLTDSDTVTVSVLSVGEHVGKDLDLSYAQTSRSGVSTRQLVIQVRARGGGSLPAGTKVRLDKFGIIRGQDSWRPGGDVNVDPAEDVDTTAPSVPTGVSATATGQTTATVTWAASTDDVSAQGALVYKVYRDTVLVDTTAAGVTSFDDTGLTADTTYSYTVSAVDEALNESAQSTADTATTDPVPKNLLVVTDTLTYPAALQAAIDHLELDGWTVTGRLDTDVPNQATDESTYDAIWVQGSVSHANTEGDYVSHAIPVVISKGDLGDDHGLSSVAGAGSSARTAIKFTDVSHAITTGLSLGDVTVYTVADNHEHLSGTIAGTTLAVGADADSENAEIRLTVVEQGEALQGALGNAAATRVFLFFTPGNHEGDRMNAAMSDLLSRIFDYLAP